MLGKNADYIIDVLIFINIYPVKCEFMIPCGLIKFPLVVNIGIRNNSKVFKFTYNGKMSYA